MKTAEFEPHPDSGPVGVRFLGENGSLSSGRSICGVRLGGEKVGECLVGVRHSKWNRVDFLHFCLQREREL